MEFSAELIRKQLAGRPRRTIAEWEARPAAVLLPLFARPGGLSREREGTWRLLFTERTHDVEDHKGQVAFPGGRVDEGDGSRVHTALREAEEEIGLARQDVTVLGALDELLTVTQYRVTPVVGTFRHPYRFRTSRAEIADIFDAPLDWLADPANLETQYRTSPIGGPPIPVYYFRYQGHTIWGVTARIVVQLLEVIRSTDERSETKPISDL